jgi:hypothetical protein
MTSERLMPSPPGNPGSRTLQGGAARIRAKLLQMNSALDADGSCIAGIHENITVRENGIWRISRMDLDYVWTAKYAGGWARVGEGANRRCAPQTPNISLRS